VARSGIWNILNQQTKWFFEQLAEQVQRHIKEGHQATLVPFLYEMYLKDGKLDERCPISISRNQI
jgi:hypothetical protein